MGFLENQGHKALPPLEELRKYSTPKLILWVFALPFAALALGVVLMFTGALLIGAILAVLMLLFGGFLSWGRLLHIAPIIYDRQSQPKPPKGSKRVPPRPSTATLLMRDSLRQQSKRNHR